MANPAVWTIIGVLLTIATLVGNVVYRSGHLSARVESLETWRGEMRDEMHDVSRKLEENNNLLHQLATLIEERTERRIPLRAFDKKDKV